jgi:hypothetical protein
MFTCNLTVVRQSGMDLTVQTLETTETHLSFASDQRPEFHPDIIGPGQLLQRRMGDLRSQMDTARR